MEGTVGKILRAQRESLKLSIEDVAEKTSFRIEYIEKLENDDYTCFKTPIYAKGTIRGYANFLGLDGLALVEQFKQNELEKVSFAGNDIGQETIDAITKSKVNENLIQQPGIGTQTSFSRDDSSLPVKQIIFGLALIGIIVSGCYFAPGLKFDKVEISFVDRITAKVTEFYDTLTNLVPENRKQQQETKVEEKVATKENTTGFNEKLKENIATKNKDKAIIYSKPTQSSPVKKVDKNSIAARYDKVVVEMTATGQCWIDVFSDGKAIYSGMMTNGRYKIFEANKRVTVRYGNIGVMQVVVNGKPVNMRGEAGVATRHYPR